MRLSDIFTVFLLVVSVCISAMHILTEHRNKGIIWAWVAAFWLLNVLRSFSELSGL